MAIKDTFLAGILAHLPEAERGKAQVRLEELETGELRQSEFSKLADEAKAAQKRFDDLYAANTEWFEEKKGALAEADVLRAKVVELEKRPAATPLEIPADVIRKKDFDEQMAATERGAVGFIATANALTMKHYQQFGEILNITDLLSDKRVQTIGLEGVYADKFKDQIAAKAKTAQDLRDEQLRKEGEERIRASFANRPAYPVIGNEPSALDALEAERAGTKPQVSTVEQMADSYARLSATRTGSGSAA